MRGAEKLWGRPRESGETCEGKPRGCEGAEVLKRWGQYLGELGKHNLGEFLFFPRGVPGKEKEGEKKGHLLSVYSVRRRL